MSKPDSKSTHLKVVDGGGGTGAAAPKQEHHSAPSGQSGQKSHAPSSGRGNVVALPGMCMAEDCKQKSAKANFCKEHFDWFKEGLITKEGRRPSDFEKKFFDYSRRKKPAA